MASRRVSDQPERNRRPPATTPEAQENRLVALAVDLAEKQLRDGTASSQVITHFLKVSSSRDQLEREKIRQENLLMEKKIESFESAKRVEALYEEALNAMRSYAGQDPVMPEPGDEYYEEY